MIVNTPKELMCELKHAMDLNDIPFKYLADKLNTSPQNISKKFIKANPQLDSLFEICNTLDFNIDISFSPKK